jgi:multiple sugar transport system ATP-binding protein
MANIELAQVSKRFGAVQVLDNISLSIASGEFVVFLGPSGCGKSTLLRMIAGLESVDSGEIHIGDRRVDQLPPNQREIAMVFQNYALYPHMTVRGNMSFGLENIGTAKDEIARRVAAAAKMLEIEHLLDRRPAQLSGGQRQRVAIGRSIVRDPKAFLLDEPLSNLDAGLRVRTRVELAQLHHRMKATMIFVTHDQTEAMTLADRIVVMNNRKIEQIGSPMEVYSRPATRFVASFVGSPAMNFLPVSEVTERNGLADLRLGGGAVMSTAIGTAQLPSDGEFTLGIRAEAVRPAADGAITGTAEIVERLGERTLIYVQLTDGSTIVAEDEGLSRIRAGETVTLAMKGDAAMLFDKNDIAYHGPQVAH